MDPKSELKTIQARMAVIVDGYKSSGDLTDAQTTELQELNDRATELKAAILRAEKSADEQHRVAGEPIDQSAPTFGAPVGMKGFLTPEALKRTIDAEVKSGTKAFVAGGSTLTATSLDPNPVALARPLADLSLFNILQVTTRDKKDYAYLRQTVRTNNAAPVATGAQKPTSVYTVESVTAQLQVVAHISEYIDTYLLQDNANLEGFLSSEMTSGLWTKVNALGVAAISGATGAGTQAFTNNAMDSIYLGASAAEDLGYHPDAVLISRADWNAIALAKDTAGNYLYRTPGDSRINGLVPIISTGLAAKTAVVFDSSQVGLSVDKQGVQLKWDPFTKLDYNQARLLTEARVGFDILAPKAIVKVGTAA